MLKQNNNRPSISHMQKDRMRYRGPIESQKIYNFQQMLYKDIMNIEQQLIDSKKILLQYATETFLGSEQEVIIANNEETLFQCYDNQAIHNIIRKGGINQWVK